MVPTDNSLSFFYRCDVRKTSNRGGLNLVSCVCARKQQLIASNILGSNDPKPCTAPARHLADAEFGNQTNVLTLTCCCESGDCGDNASPFHSATGGLIRKAAFTCEDTRERSPERANAAVCRHCGRSLPSSSR